MTGEFKHVSVMSAEVPYVLVPPPVAPSGLSAKKTIVLISTTDPRSIVIDPPLVIYTHSPELPPVQLDGMVPSMALFSLLLFI